MSRYNKLIAAVLGNLAAIVLSWAALKWPAIVECAPALASVTEAYDEVCQVSILGLHISPAQLTAGLMLLVNALFVERSPANTK